MSKNSKNRTGPLLNLSNVPYSYSVFGSPLYKKKVKYSNHLNTGLGWYSNGRFVSGCQMIRYLNDGLKKPVYGSKCPVFKWSAKPHDFTIKILDTNTVRYSDEGIQVFGIRMLTVLKFIFVHFFVIFQATPFYGQR